MATLRPISSNQSTGTNFTCSKPPGTTSGDVLIAFQTNSAGGSMPTPTGGGTAWQPLGSRADESGEWVGSRVWWKIAGPNEPSSYGFVNGSGLAVVAIAAISDADGAIPRINSQKNSPSDDSVTAPSVIATNSAGVTLRWAAAVLSSSGSWMSPPGHTELMDRSVPSLGAASLAFRSRPVPGATGPATFTWNGQLGITPIFSHGFTVDVGGTAVPPPEPEPAIPPSKDIHYRYEFADLLTDDFIANLDLSDVSYDRRIGEAGTFSATIPIPSSKVAAKVAAIIPRYPEDLSTGPGRTVCHIYRNGIIWGSYLIWSATIEMSDRGGLSARISGATLESYLDHVEIREDLDYVGEDQVQIARNLIDSMQAQTHANIGLTTESGTSGVERDAIYLADENSTYGARLKDLTSLDNSFEWLIQTYDSGTGRVREWQWGYPQLGQTDTEHVFTMPGNVIGFSEDIDALRGGTSFVARGESNSDDLSTSSGPTLSAPHDALAHFTAGWPRLDATITAHFERDTDTLDDYAARWAATNAGAVRVHQVTIRLDGDDFTPANLGDRARVVLVNDWWPRVNGGASFNRSWRVIGISVNATTRGQRESAQLVFEEVVE